VSLFIASIRYTMLRQRNKSMKLQTIQISEKCVFVYGFADIEELSEDNVSHEQTETSEEPTLMELLNHEVERQKMLVSKSTSDNQRTAVNSFIRYLDGHPIRLTDLEADHIKGFSVWLLRHGKKQNTAACYLRSLRSLLNRFGDYGQLFKRVRTSNTKTDKRSVNEEVILKLASLPLKDREYEAFARDMFLFCFYAMGMPFVDLAYLKKSQVRDGHIEYYRHKTRQRVRVALNPACRKIINKYSKAGSPFLFPILKEQTDKDYRYALGRYNRALRRLSNLLRLDRPLTSYIPRHSWATIAYKGGLELSAISKVLGHTNPNTTLLYIRELDDSYVDRANEIVLKIMNKKEKKWGM